MSEVEKKVAMIPEEVFNAVVEFLLAKPYGEVAHLVDAIKGNVQMANLPEQPELTNKEMEGGTI